MDSLEHRTAEALSDHWWVQIAEGESWRDLDVLWPAEETAPDGPERARIRAGLGLTEGETAFVYSGSLAAWQCVREAAELFADIDGGVVRVRTIRGGPDTHILATDDEDKKDIFELVSLSNLLHFGSGVGNGSKMIPGLWHSHCYYIADCK